MEAIDTGRDIIDTGIALAKGDLPGAAVAAASIFAPKILETAGDLFKAGRRIGNAAESIGDAAKAIENTGDAAKAASKGAGVGYHATTPEAAKAIQQNGFRLGTKPGRLGSGGVYVNNTVEGAMAEFAHHNPGISPSVLKVQYQTGVNAMASTPPANYVMQYPLNVGSISAESVRLPGTFNTNILNGTAIPTGIVP